MMQARLGVPHRSGWITVDRTKVPSTLNQKMPNPPPLPHSHQGGINRHVTMRMEVAHGFADDFRALHMLAVRLHPKPIHCV